MKTNKLLMIALGIGLPSCGEVKEKTEKASERSAAATGEKGFILKAESSAFTQNATSLTDLDLFADLNLHGYLFKIVKDVLPQAKINITLKDASNKIVFQETKPGGSHNLTIPTKTEGVFHLEISAEHANTTEYPAPEKIKKTFKVDRTNPVIAVVATQKTHLTSGSRKVDIKVTAKGGETLKCDDVKISEASVKEAKVFTGKISMKSQSSDQIELIASGIEIPSSSPGVLQADVVCYDEAKNPGRNIVAVQEDELGIQLAAQVDAKVGVPIGTQSAIAFAKSGNLNLQFSLIDPSNAQKVDATILAKEKGSLKLYISETQENTVANILASRGIAATTWKDNFPYPMREALVGERTFFATLTKTKKVDGSNDLQEFIVNTVPVKVFIDRSAPELTWVSKARYIPAAMNVQIPIQIKIEMGGAPLDGIPAFEYSIDNTNWTAFNPIEWTAQADNNYTFKVKYPFTEEKPYRIRVKAKDLAGNETISKVSPNMIGKVGLDISVSDQTRDACLTSATNDGAEKGSKLKPFLASSYLCKVLSDQGQDTGVLGAAIFLANHGRKPIFANVNEQLGYKMIANNQPIDDTWAFISSDSFSSLDYVNKTIPFYYSLNSSDLQTSKLELQFDIEENPQSGFYPYSTNAGSACYAYDGNDRPKITLKDNNQPLLESPFACDPMEQ